MKRQATWLAVAICVLRTADALSQETASRATDPMAMLMAGRYADVDASMTAVQDDYKRGVISDEQLLVRFRAFYDLTTPEAERHFDEWVRAKPDSYVARLARGIHYKYVGLVARGDEYTIVTPDARLWRRNAAFARAAEDLSASIDLDEKPLLSFHHLIDPGGSLLRFSSNRRLLDKAIALDPGNLVVRRKYLITLPARWGGSIAEMKAFLSECREAGLPDEHLKKLEYELAKERAWLAFDLQHDYARAERIYVDLIAADPDDVKVAEFYISSLIQQKKWDAAVAASSRFLERHPGDSHALASRGLSYVHLEKFDEGIRDYDAAGALGNVWAQKELARLYWQGTLVTKDRERALSLLRKAADSGDPEAQREFARVTGENIVTKRSRWLAILPFAGLGFFFVLVGAWTEYRRDRIPDDVSDRRLIYPLAKFVNGAGLFTMFAGGLVASLMYPGRPETLYIVISLGALALLAVPGVFAYLFVRHDLTPGGLSFTRFLGLRGALNWLDVRRVSFTPRTKRIRIEDAAGKVAYLSPELLNLPLFAHELLGQASRSAIEDSVAPLLDVLRTAHGFADWSDADIEAQQAASAARITMLGGTDTAGMALFSTGLLPDSRSLDDEAVATLERDSQAIRFEIHGDGPFLLHLYLDVATPESVIKYALPGSRRSSTLRVSSGGIAFGDVESMCSDFQPNASLRTDVTIRAGEYEAESYVMAYPAAMMRAAVRQCSAGLRSPWMRIPPIAIALVVLVALGTVAFQWWWATGALLALAGVAAGVFFRSATRRALVRKFEAKQLNFPSLVVSLTSRPT